MSTNPEWRPRDSLRPYYTKLYPLNWWLADHAVHFTGSDGPFRFMLLARLVSHRSHRITAALGRKMVSITCYIQDWMS